MKNTRLSGLSERYLTALRAYVDQVPPGDLTAAHELGAGAVVMGLETLDLAKVHERALAALLSPQDAMVAPEALTHRASLFFAEAITPIERTHHLALEAEVELKQVNEALVLRTVDLAESRRELQEGIARRKDADECLQTSKAESTRLLAEARGLQQHLQELARQILTAQEEERKRLSLTLHDEIAQTLLAIHVRLLALDRELSISEEGFQKEIATTQRLVEESVKTISRLARECGIQYEE